ncbi:hypothetical protein [Kineosporia sp. R_H_3]|uniref:hypothetical protein n=1 Tax=Kineosporia sp. R_H_3 TaxID=1961848 RepID=UPI000B4BC3AB|nr:hypothetical protein [Kineosporia sp. R_H_3]
MSALAQVTTEVPVGFQTHVTTRQPSTFVQLTSVQDEVSSLGTTKNIEWRRQVDLGPDGLGGLVSLEVDVRKTESYVSVVDPTTGIFGVGGSLAEAVADFREALTDFREVLRHQDDLAPAMARLLAELLRLAPTKA